MTNEPPTNDGEELVEADLPGLDDSPADSVIPDLHPPEEAAPDPAFWAERAREHGLFETRDRMVDIFGTPDRPEPPLRTAESPAPPNQDVADSVLDELAYDLPSAMAGDIDPPIQEAVAANPPVLDDSEEELVEADLPTTRSPNPPPQPPEPEPSFDEVVDERIRQIGENLEADQRARDEARARAYREEYGPDVDAEAMLRADEAQGQQSSEPLPLFQRVLPSSLAGKMLTLILAALGFTAAIFAAFAFLGGSDESAAVESSARNATVAAPTQAAAAATSEPTEAAALSDEPSTVSSIDDLVLESVVGMTDLEGDLWLQLELARPLGVDPDTLAFVYAFAIGAAIQTDNGYSGFYYSITDGSSYAESVFGSADFPRTSRAFSQNFQIARADLWMTDGGQLAIHLLGDAAGNGLDASLYGPDAALIAGVAAVAKQGDVGVGGFEELTLGEPAVAADLPLASWVEIDPDLEPITLNVPDTSNSN